MGPQQNFVLDLPADDALPRKIPNASKVDINPSPWIPLNSARKGSMASKIVAFHT